MEKSFVDFTVAVAKDDALGEEFHKELHKGSPADLNAWFHKKGYHVPEAECKKMVENKDTAKGGKVGIAW